MDEKITNGNFVVFYDGISKIVDIGQLIDFMLEKGISESVIEYAIGSAMNDGNYYVGNPPIMKIACNGTAKQLIKYNLEHPYQKAIGSYLPKELSNA